VSVLELRRARDLPDLLRESFRLYFGHFGVFVAISAAIVLPVELIVSGVGMEQLSGPYEEEPTLAESLVPTLVSFLVLIPLITAACVYALQDLAAGAHPRVGETLTRGLEAFTPLFLALLVAGLGIALGLALLIVPGVYLAIRWFFVPQAVVLDGRRGVEPLRRSGEVVEGFWWRTFGVIALANLVAFLPGLVIVSPLEALAESADRELIALAGRSLVELLTTPFLALVATLLWFDLQERGYRP
jgi:hypothetical protein